MSQSLNLLSRRLRQFKSTVPVSDLTSILGRSQSGGPSRRLGALVDEGPFAISGVTGPKADLVNGTYAPTGELHNGKTLFRKVNDADKWLRYATDGSWMVSPTSNKDANDNNCWAHSVEEELAHPALTKSWKTCEGGKWEVKYGVKIKVRTSLHFWDLLLFFHCQLSVCQSAFVDFT